MNKQWVILEQLDNRVFVKNTHNPKHTGEWTTVEDLAWLNGERETVTSTPEEIAAMFAEMDADHDNGNV